MREIYSRHRALVLWTVITTLLIEGITLYLRIVIKCTAQKFNATNPPLVLQMHHMFWSIPLFLMLLIPFVRKTKWLKAATLGLALGLVISDLSHHFIAMPILERNIGWHWP